MDDREAAKMFIKKADGLFSLTEEENNVLTSRIKEFDETELQNFVNNFDTIGLYKVIELIYNIYLAD